MAMSVDSLQVGGVSPQEALSIFNAFCHHLSNPMFTDEEIEEIHLKETVGEREGEKLSSVPASRKPPVGDWSKWSDKIFKAMKWSQIKGREGEQEQFKLIECLKMADPQANNLFNSDLTQWYPDGRFHVPSGAFDEYQLAGSTLPMMGKLSDELDKHIATGYYGAVLDPAHYYGSSVVRTMELGETSHKPFKGTGVRKKGVRKRRQTGAFLPGSKDKHKARSGYYNEHNVFDDVDSSLYHHDGVYSASSLPFDDRNHYEQLINGGYNDVSGSGSSESLLIGGVVGASAVIIIMLIFCLGLAFGMVIYWGYSQKKALDVNSKKGEMRNWIEDDEDRNEV
eukprot:902741_1